MLPAADELNALYSACIGDRQSPARSARELVLGLVKYHRGELDEAERIGADAMQCRTAPATPTSSFRNCGSSRSTRSPGDAPLAEKWLTAALSIASKTVDG